MTVTEQIKALRKIERGFNQEAVRAETEELSDMALEDAKACEHAIETLLAVNGLKQVMKALLQNP